MKKLLITSFTLLCIISVWAQSDSLTAQLIGHGKTNTTEPIITDRPDQTESAFTIPARKLQIETGLIFENVKSKEINVDNWALGTTLLRYGVWDNFELRLGNYYQQTTGHYNETNTDTTESGLGPILAGFKVHVVEEKGIRPQIAILADLTLRHVGSLSYRPVYSYPTAKIAFSHTISDKLSFGYNTGFGYNGSNADGFFIYSAAVGYSIFEKVSIFGEVYGNFDHGDLPNHRIDGGITWLVKNNFQFDVSGGLGFDKDIDKYFISAGFSWLIPK